jgi:ATP:corrinoid adenosyltransferase
MSEGSESERDLQHAQAMMVLQQERRAERATKMLRGGLLIVLTGAGKGKSSSAFGMVARALGWDMRVGIVQFIKGKWQTGEKHFFRRFPSGRDAPARLLEIADLVTEMTSPKHPYHAGFKAQRGVEF